MSDLLAIGASGVRAYQSALTIVGSNISNASTPGYARRDITLAESPAAYANGITTINRAASGGVDVAGVARAWDQFKAADVRTASADVAASDASVTYLTRIESALSGSDISGGLTAFFNSAQALAADPTSTAARTQLLSDADTAAGAFRTTAGALAAVSKDVLADAQTSVATLNGLSNQLAQLNTKIAGAQPNTTGQATLLDQRDQLIDQMSSLASISVETASNGVATVRLNQPTGPALVQGATATHVAVSANASGTLAYTLGAGASAQAVGFAGGALAGLADAATRATNASAVLDETATSFADAVNGVQAQGVDLAGKPGAAMFTTGYATAAALPGASGGANIQVGLAAGATPAAGGYTAIFDQASDQWTLARADGSAQVSGNGTLVLDGVTVQLGGAPVGGDGYAITTASGAAGLATTDLQPKGIAAASAWASDSPIANAGTAALTVVTSGTPAASNFTLRYAAGIVTVTNSATNAVIGTAAYSAGTAIQLGGMAFTFTGTPADGDSFTVSPSGSGSRDNSNLAGLTTIRQTGGFEGRIDDLSNQTATTLASRKALADAQGSIRDNAITARDDVSAVNLDQEAVDLLRFQQAYQAASRVVSVARETFQSLIDIQ